MSRDALAEEQRLRVQVLSEVPRVAGRHLHDRRVDRNELAARDLGAAAAGGADAERDLVTAAPVIARPAEDMRAAPQLRAPVSSARARVGSVSSASATRSFSWVVRGL